MITPRNIPGTVRVKDREFLIKIRANQYYINMADLSPLWQFPTDKTAEVTGEDGFRAGLVSRLDKDAFQVIIGNHPYLIPVKDLSDTMAARQLAAPLIEQEPGQTALVEVEA